MSNAMPHVERTGKLEGDVAQVHGLREVQHDDTRIRDRFNVMTHTTKDCVRWRNYFEIRAMLDAVIGSHNHSAGR